MSRNIIKSYGKCVESNRDLIVAAYAAFNRRDIDAVFALMDPAVDWRNCMDGTRVVGHAQVRDYWTRQRAEINPNVEPVVLHECERGDTIVEVQQLVRDL